MVGPSAICGAVGEYDESVVLALAGAFRAKYESRETYKDKGVMVVGLHSPGGSNIAWDEGNRVMGAVAGEVFARTGEGHERAKGASALADGWVSYGTSTPLEMDGAFACVVYDSRSRRCFAFNDFIGQVPLFHTRFQGGTYFASQLGPLLRNEVIPAAIDRRGVRSYFTFGCIPGERTILAGARKLLPGSLAVLGPHGVKATKYWRIGDVRPDTTVSGERFVDKLGRLLDSSVRSRLEGAESPFGIMLGGLDSSVIAALMRRNTQEKIVALTATFEDSRFNQPGVERVASLLDLDLKEVLVTLEDMPAIIEAMAGAFDEPVSDMIASPIAFAVAKRGGVGLRSIFDGTGADDLFQGIPHGSRKLDAVAGMLPSTIMEAVQNRVEKLYGGPSARDRVPGLISPLLTSPVRRELTSWMAMDEEEVSALIGPEEKGTEDVFGPMVEGVASDLRGLKRDPAGISVKTAVSLYLGPTHGFDCSRNRAISLEYGVSLVSPFYFRDLYDVGLSVPWRLKTPTAGLSKPLLRRIAIHMDLLPPEVALLPKMGLGSSRGGLEDTQTKAWASDGLSRWMLETIDDNCGPVKHLIDRSHANRFAREGSAYKTFEVLQFVLWYKKYFGERRIELGPL